MKILGISLDPSILDKESIPAQRIIKFGQNLDKYYLLVPTDKDQKSQLAANIFVESLGSHNKFFLFFKIYKRISEIIKNEKFDLLTTQDAYFLSLILIFLSRKHGIKFEVQIHGFEKYHGLRKLLANYSLRQADIIRTVSIKTKEYLVDNFSIPAKKIYVSPVFVDRQKIENSKNEFSLRDLYQNDFIFLTVGRLVPVKNIVLQIRAIKKLNLDKVKLVIVGEGPDKANLQALVARENLNKSIIFVDGYIKNLADYYKSADCLLITSNMEGYCMVVAEAVLADLPVIMTDVGCANDLVENNINGFVIPINNLDVLVAKMKKVVEDQKLLTEFKTRHTAYKEKILSQQALSDIIIDNWQKVIYGHEK
ncbi:MAG: glycosyltransferase [Patescibacteria group bacterium]|jgi:glycosyltransferase involved in cell wall biosynthesis